MSNENILDWYEGKSEVNDLDSKELEDKETVFSENIPVPTTSDLNPVPPSSPQVDIQQELINNALGANLTMKNDPVIAVDKTNIYKAYTLLKIIEQKIKMLNHYSGSQVEDPIKKEGLASDVKALVQNLSDITGAL